jgi:hypothetical protein
MVGCVLVPREAKQKDKAANDVPCGLRLCRQTRTDKTLQQAKGEGREPFGEVSRQIWPRVQIGQQTVSGKSAPGGCGSSESPARKAAALRAAGSPEAGRSCRAGEGQCRTSGDGNAASATRSLHGRHMLHPPIAEGRRREERAGHSQADIPRLPTWLLIHPQLSSLPLTPPKCSSHASHVRHATCRRKTSWSSRKLLFDSYLYSMSL